MTDQYKSTDERNVDRHDPAGYAAWLRERAKANRDVALLPREQWPYRPAVLQHWAFRFEQGAELIERLERALVETHDAWTAETTKRLQAVHERDCAVEDVKRLQMDIESLKSYTGVYSSGWRSPYARPTPPDVSGDA